MADLGIGEVLLGASAVGAAGPAIPTAGLLGFGGEASLAGIGTAASTLSSIVGGIGSIASGNASAAASKYNSQLAAQNAQIAQQNATWASQAGEQQVGEQSQKTRATVGAIKAAQAANNLDVNSGSAVDVRSSAAALGELSALNIRSNAARTAYGDLTQQASYSAQSKLDTFSADQEQLAGEVGAGTSVLGGVGNAGLNFAKYLNNNTISPSQ